MNYIAYGFFIFTLLFDAQAVEFEQVNIAEYNKESLSERIIRFTSKTNPKKVIFLQIDKYDPENLWNKKTLDNDVQAMFKKRKTIYDLLGFKQVNFKEYQLTNIDGKLPALTISGSYLKSKSAKDKTYFAETNIYYAKNFLQVKVIDEEKISAKEVEDLLLTLRPSQLEIN